MDNSSRTVTIHVHPSRDDTRRIIEFSCRPPKIRLKYIPWALTAAAVLGAAGYLLRGVSPEDIHYILFSVAITIATYAITIAICKWIVARIRYRHEKKQTERMLAELESDPHPDIVISYSFDDKGYSVVNDRDRISGPYGEILLLEERSDGFFIHTDLSSRIIPARFVSAEDYIALTALFRTHCAAYTVTEPMRTPGTPEQAEPPALPEPLALAEYTLTAEEKAQVVELSPPCFPEFGTKAIKNYQKNMMAENDDFSTVLYEDGVVVRHSGQAKRFFYGEVEKVTDAGDFILLNVAGTAYLHPVPVRALDDKETFLRMLTERVEADKEGAIYAQYERADRPDTPVIAEADMKAGRTLLRARFDGKDILYRRRFGVTELIIDGKIYAQNRHLIENIHSLTVWVDGIRYIALLNHDNHSYLIAGRRVLCKKLRLI